MKSPEGTDVALDHSKPQGLFPWEYDSVVSNCSWHQALGSSKASPTMDILNVSYTELLITIFDFIHEPKLCSDTRSAVYTPILLSHVCHRWHEVILDLPRYWTSIHLSHIRHLSVTQDLLRRSAPLPLALSIELAKPAYCSWNPDSTGFKSFIPEVTDPTVISRLRDLQVSAPYNVLSAFTARASVFPRLENLVLREVDTLKNGAGYLGPLSFNAEVFRNICLDGVGIRLSRSSDLSGIQCLSLVGAPENILDQTRLLNPDSPSEETEPSMTKLVELRLTDRLRHALGVPLNQHSTPSFGGSTLKYLYLATYVTRLPTGALRRALNPMSLEELELDRISLPALCSLFHMISNQGAAEVEEQMPFARLHALTIRGVVGFFRELVNFLLRPLPQLRLLRLLEMEEVDIDEFAAAFSNTQLCPFLASFWANGVEHYRRDVASIAPP
ncbi:hypothetical protein NP233_g8451 [Leucocoprinus birnbaumii]|uniref:F-box domain-containing protein n=1 Tax=Leucocoprinus birnbaumii TaxID=56174 RepID=A0AAD5VMA7_9AGAR|nr:hypothetical protein NP233_g8451 [Leucocoprinus birnbaumii]